MISIAQMAAVMPQSPAQIRRAVFGSSRNVGRQTSIGWTMTSKHLRPSDFIPARRNE